MCGAGSRPAESLTEIRRAGERARDLIDQILSFGRRSEAGRQRFRLDVLIADARSLLVATLPSTVKFEIVQDADEITVLTGIPGQLQQVLVNICNNAIQAVDGQGAIEMATRLVDSTAPLPLAHARLPAGRYVVVSISDNGRGMDQVTQEQIFEPFFTTPRRGERPWPRDRAGDRRRTWRRHHPSRVRSARVPASTSGCPAMRGTASARHPHPKRWRAAAARR